MREPFPLQWPEGWTRTPPRERKASRFVTGMSRSAKECLRQLEMLGASNVVITSDLPTRRNGLPYGDAADSGIAVWFVWRDVERVMASDCWQRAAENVHAIALSLEAIRGLERWGASDIVVRAFQGFAQLPSGDPAPAPSRPWWQVLCVQRDNLEPPLAALARAKRNHRMLMKHAHPDHGGSHESATELNIALREAERELDRPDSSDTRPRP